MGVSSSRARVADLAFQVFNRALHPDWFSTRVYRRIPQERWEADVRIIEGGHAVIFGTGSIRLTEVLAGPETTLPEPGLVFHSGIRSERSTSLHPGGIVEYLTCFEVERVEPEVFRVLCEEMIADGSRHSLLHRFGSSNRLAPPPLSHVCIEARVKGLSVQSFHTFPDEHAIVLAISLRADRAGSQTLIQPDVKTQDSDRRVRSGTGLGCRHWQHGDKVGMLYSQEVRPPGFAARSVCMPDQPITWPSTN